jgi:hypothetical protein
MFGWILAVPVLAQSGATPKSPLKISLCEVSRNPLIYDGKEIQFHAQFMTDHVERSLLISDDCPGKAILPYLSEKAIGAAAFDDASSVRAPMNLDESISATFTGIFHFTKKPEMCMQLDKEICRRSIEINRVDDLVLTMIPKKQR